MGKDLKGEALGQAAINMGLFEHIFNKPPTEFALVLINSI